MVANGISEPAVIFQIFFQMDGGFSAGLADFETQKVVEVPDFGIFLPLKIESN